MSVHPLSIRTFHRAPLEAGSPAVQATRADGADSRLGLRQNYRPGRPVPGWLARVLSWL